jgi:uncharacterized lipoprotein
MANKRFKLIRLVVSCLSSILIFSVISGCAQKVTPKFLRNREYDYARKEVVQPPVIKVPNGVKAPDFDPNYTLPKGRDDYPPVKSNKDTKVLPPPALLPSE